MAASLIALRPDDARGPGGVYLDTNAASGLFIAPQWSEDARRLARRRLVELARSGLPVLVSRALLEELAALARVDRHLHRNLVDHLWDVSGPHFLRGTAELARREVRAGGPLPWSERFESREARRALWDAGEGSDEIGRALAEFALEERERRDRLTTLLRMDAALERSTAAAASYTEQWVRDVLRRDAAALGLPVDAARWPQPRSAFTVWNLVAYKAARIHRNVGEGRSVGLADQYDAEHYAAACYAKVLVTDDDDLRTTCELAGASFRIVDLHEFARDVLAVPA